jgi:hypothetical protein
LGSEENEIMESGLFNYVEERMNSEFGLNFNFVQFLIWMAAWLAENRVSFF